MPHEKAFPHRSFGFFLDCYPHALQETTANGHTPLHVAALCFKSTVEGVRLLVERCPQALEVRDAQRRLPLHNAAQGTSAEVVQHLIDKCPAALEVKDCNGLLPLHYAGLSGAVVECLVKANRQTLVAKTNFAAKTKFRFLPLHLCNLSALGRWVAPISNCGVE